MALLEVEDLRVEFPTRRGVLVAVDRQEVATGSSRSAVRELADRLSVPVLSIVSLEDLVTHMQAHPAVAQHLPAMRAYRERYGAK